MADLLIHSMSEFADIVLGCLETAGAREVVEIGAEFGGMSKLLAEYAARKGGTLTSIDPSPKPEFLEWVGAQGNVRPIASTSLAAVPDLTNVDAWVIDGDHNWYTVYHELKAVDAVCRRDGKPLLAFMHDVGWPCGRRDAYYAPERIPEAFRHPYCYEGGVKLDCAELVSGRGFRGVGQFAFALHEGGPRNGVLTALEDFVAEAQAETSGRRIACALIPAVFGMAVVFDADAPWANAVGGIVAPLHMNKLLDSLEINRLRNYLHVLDLQDNAAAAEAQAA